MNNKVLFSIICPVYNAEKTLASSVESVKNQDYENWELILVDDGSIDSSGFLCDQFAKKDPRIKVIHKTNEGQAKVRLEGAIYCKGDYLLFLDSDDQYEPNAFRTIYEKINSTKFDLAVYNANKICNGSKSLVYRFDSKEIDSPIVECFCKRRVSYFWSICVKRELFLKIDDVVKDTFSKLRYSEDLYLIYNIIKNVKSENFFVIDNELYNYIVNDNSITNTQNSTKLMDRFFAFNYVYEDIFKKYPELFKLIKEEEKDSAGWTSLSAARKIALEYEETKYFKDIKTIRLSFLFKHLSKFKKDKYNYIIYILLKLKMYRRFRKYIIKHER